MILNRDFEDPIEFFRLMQEYQEIKELINALGNFRHMLAKYQALDGFKALIMGFEIKYADSTRY